MTEITSKWWFPAARWVAILPGAVLCAVAIKTLGYISFGSMMGFTPDSLAWYVLLPFLSGCYGVGFVLGGAYTAPAHKDVVAIVLATLLGVAALLGVAIAFRDGGWWNVVHNLTPIAGAIGATVWLRQR